MYVYRNSFTGKVGDVVTVLPLIQLDVVPCAPQELRNWLTAPMTRRLVSLRQIESLVRKGLSTTFASSKLRLMALIISKAPGVSP